MVELLKMKANGRRNLPHPHPHSYISPYTLILVIDIFIFDIFTFRHFYLSTKVGLTFLTTGTGTGLSRSDRTGSADLPVRPATDRSTGRPGPDRPVTGTGPAGNRYRFHLCIILFYWIFFDYTYEIFFF
jgi:hypothetical protein